MREIKFRAWDKQGHRILPVNALHFDTGLVDVSLASEPRVFRDDSQFILMQLTGLKDKNGREIYEGDIVRYGDFEDDGNAKNWEVKYGADDYYPAFDLKDWDGDTNGLCWALHDGHLIVIGNIYENRDLLSAETDRTVDAVLGVGDEKANGDN